MCVHTPSAHLFDAADDERVLAAAYEHVPDRIGLLTEQILFPEDVDLIGESFINKETDTNGSGAAAAE